MAQSFIELNKAEPKTESKQKKHPAVDVTGVEARSDAVKEQYCIGTCNVRYVNQDKLEVVKQEMARVNINILGISNLKCTGMGKFYYFSIPALRTP